ncbi:MAG: hypothetical protein KAW92_03700 [Candidatus Cloacimonetes bacterium]|nr:hypothetical protein [Candidatus Cloacimonadota bacterium]
MFFTETDRIKIGAIKIENLREIDFANKKKIKQIIKDIKLGKGYTPIKVSHDLDHDTYMLKEGLETYMACWKLGFEWIEAEINL